MTTGAHAVSRPILTLATVHVDKNCVTTIRDALKTLSNVEVTADFQAYASEPAGSQLLEKMQQRGFDICIIDFDVNRQEAAATSESIRNNFPDAVVFAISANADPELIIQAMHVGCSEYLIKPLAKDRVVQAVVRLERKRREAVPGKRGRLYTFLGAKGGTGVTTLATHLAAYVGRQGGKTLLIDQHSDLGDVPVYFSLGEQRYHFYELVNNVHRLDAQLLEGFLLHHEPGLDILPSPESFGGIVQVAPTALRHTLAFLREMYDAIFIDCAPGLNGANVVAIEEADAVYLVATPELAPIRNLARCLDYLKHYHCPDDKIHVVVNRYSKKPVITQQQIEKAIQRQIALTIPNSYPDVIAAINSGQPMPFDSRSELVSALRRWAATLAVDSPQVERVAEAPRRKSGILFGMLGL